MTKDPHLKNLVEEISSIQRMELGHLSIIRQGPGGPYYNLQRRVDGRNLTEYVPRVQVPILEEHIAAHERFKELVTQYEDILTEQSRTLRKQGQAEEAKKTGGADFNLAREAEVQSLMSSFEGCEPTGPLVADLEQLLREAIFKPAGERMGALLQQAADRIDAEYRAKPGERRKGRSTIEVQGMFGTFALTRDYYHHAGKKCGRCPADDALGLEGSLTPALARIVCLEGADESSYQKAATHLQEVGGIPFDERTIHRVVACVGERAALW